MFRKKFRVVGKLHPDSANPHFVIEEKSWLFGRWRLHCHRGSFYALYPSFELALDDLVVLSTTAQVKDRGNKTWVIVKQQKDNTEKVEEVIIESEKI